MAKKRTKKKKKKRTSTAKIGARRVVSRDMPRATGNAQSADEPPELTPRFTPAETERRADAAREAMAPFDVFDVVTNLLFDNLPLDVDTYRETEHHGLLAIVEYGARLCLERDARTGLGSRDDFIQGPVIEEWSHNLREVLFNDMFGQAALLEGEPEQKLSELRWDVASRELLVRHPSFENQERSTLQTLFSDPRIDSDLKQAAGFGIADALAFEEVFSSLPQYAMTAIANHARNALDSGRRLVEERRSSTTRTGEDPQEWISLLAAMPRKQAEKQLRNLATAWAWIRIGDRLQLTVEQLADLAVVDLTAAKAFLDFFSIEFGQPRARPLLGTSEMRDRPIIHDGEGNYFCVSVGDLFYGLRPRLTDALHRHATDTGSARSWERFNSVRRRYLETTAVGFLGQTLHPEVALTNGRFTLDGKDGEIDGLVILDEIAIVIEAKAGSLSAAARRGAPASLRDDLKALVKAALQLERARRALTGSDSLTLRVDRRDIVIDTTRVRRVFLVAVTLDELSFVAPTVWDLVHTDIIPAGLEPPLLSNLHDLEIICDVVDLPALLPHYFSRRLQLNRLELVRAADELDLFVHFLRHGLFFDDVTASPDPPDVIFLQSLTDDLDAYYLWRQGIRNKPASLPG